MSFMAVGVAVLALSACGNKKFEVNGNIKDAKDSTLYFENLSLNGPVVLDSVKLGEDGAFDFKADATDAPEFLPSAYSRPDYQCRHRLYRDRQVQRLLPHHVGRIRGRRFGELREDT